MALRRIKVLSADEPADADQAAFCGDVLDALFDEVKNVHSLPFTWALDATPQGALLPLGYLLAVEVAPHFNQQVEPRSRAMMRLRAYAFTDDREDRRDTDDNGVLSEEETTAGKRTVFY